LVSLPSLLVSSACTFAPSRVAPAHAQTTAPTVRVAGSPRPRPTRAQAAAPQVAARADQANARHAVAPTPDPPPAWVLKHSYWARGVWLQDVARAAGTRLGESADPAVRELVSLTQRAAGLAPVAAPTSTVRD
jgi:hypothetical protein